MALGHALLHPGRVREALAADGLADNIGAATDAALGLAGFGDPGPAAAAWAEGLMNRIKPLSDTLGGMGQQGPFAAIFGNLTSGVDGLQSKVGTLVDALEALDADALRRALVELLDAALAALPDLRIPSLRGIIHTELNA